MICTFSEEEEEEEESLMFSPFAKRLGRSSNIWGKYFQYNF